MSRHLASARCARRGHVLAWVTMQQGSMIVGWNTAQVGDLGNSKSGRDQRNPVTWARPAETVLEGRHSAIATCGCRDDHEVDLGDLVRRAKAGDTRPIVRAPLQD